jgi:glucose uptake protein
MNSLAYRAAAKDARKGSRMGLLLCLGAAALFSAAGPLVAKAFASPRPVAPYGAAVLFAAGSLLSTGPMLLYLMRRPIQGPPLAMPDYFRGSVRNHAAGLLGGLVWGAGMVVTFAAADVAGMAIAGAIGQANSLVAAVWGIFVWREFRGAPPRAHRLLALMFALYAAGLVCIGLSFR